MLGNVKDVVAGIRFETDTTELSNAERALNSLNRTLRDSGASSLALARGADSASDAISRTAKSASTATGSLTGLQTQMMTTASATQALRASTGDLNEALENMGDPERGLVLQEILTDIESTDLDSLDLFDSNEAEDFADAFERMDLEQFDELVEYGTTEGMFGDLEELRGTYDIDTKDLNKTKNILNELSEIDGADEAFRAINESSDTMASELDAGKGDPINMFEDTTVEELFKLPDKELDERFKSDEYGDFLKQAGGISGIRSNALKQIDKDSNEYSFLRGDTDSPIQGIVSHLFSGGESSIDDVLGGTLTDLKKTNDNVDSPVDIFGVSDSEIENIWDRNKKKIGTEVQGVTDASTIRDLFVTSPVMVDEPSDKTLTKRGNLWGNYKEALEERNPDAVKDDDGFFSHLFATGRGDQEPSIGESDIQELTNLTSKSEGIMESIMDADSLEDAQRRLDRIDVDSLDKLADWAEENTEAFGNFLDSYADENTMKKLQVGDIQELSKRIESDFGNDVVKVNDDTNEAVGRKLSEYQREMLAQIGSSMDPGLIGKPEAGGDLPITREPLTMALQQEMLESGGPDTSRYKEAQSLLEDVMTGHIADASVLEQPQTKRSISNVMNRRFGGDLLEGDQDIGTLIAEELGSLGKDGDRDLFDLLSPETDTTMSDPVSDALRGTDLTGDKAVIRKVTDALEAELPKFQTEIASQAAPDLLAADTANSDVDMQSMLPNEDVQRFFIGDEHGASEFISGFKQYSNGLDDQIKSLRKTRSSSFAFTRMFGRAARRGSQALSTIGLSEPRHTQALVDNLNQLNRQYKNLIPTFEATSLNLGALNVNFESMSVMLFKLTALLGPLIGGLLGLAGGAAAAATALGSLVAVGALDFFEEMEQTMVGIENRGEAMEQVMSTVKDMALEAVDPIRNVRINGETGMDIFIGAIRGALVLLNRFSYIMADVLQRDSVATALEQLHNFVYDRSGDETFADQLGKSLDQILPLLSRMFSAMLGGFGDFLEFTTWVADKLGNDFFDALSEISDLLSLVTAYGTGFIIVMIKAASAIATVVNIAVDLISALFGVNTTSRDLAFTFGQVIAIMTVASKTFAFTAAKLIWLWKTAVGLKFALISLGAHTKLAAAYNILLGESALFASVNISKLAASMGVLIARATLLAIPLILIYEALAALTSLDSVFSFELSEFQGALVLATSLAIGLVKIAATVGLISGTFSTVAGILGGITALSVGWIAIIAGAIVLLASIIEYLITGESTILEWAKNFETVRNAISRAKEELRGFKKYMKENGKEMALPWYLDADPPSVSSTGKKAVTPWYMSMGKSAIGLDTGGFIRNAGFAKLHAGEQVLSESDVNRGNQMSGRGGSQRVTIRINNNGVIGVDNFDRHIEQKFRELLNQRATQY